MHIPHLGERAGGPFGVSMLSMRYPLHRILLSATAVAVLAGAMTAPAANAASVGQTVKVTATRAYVDNKAPGRIIIGTVNKGDRFKIDRVARVTHGSAKGLWYRGTATITGTHAMNSKGVIKPFTLKGWVKAWAFA